MKIDIKYRLKLLSIVTVALTFILIYFYRYTFLANIAPFLQKESFYINNKNATKVTKIGHQMRKAADDKITYLINTPSCKIPDLDPLDFKLARFIYTNGEYLCEGKPSIFIRQNGTTIKWDMNEVWKEVRDSNHKKSGYHCLYTEFSRPKIPKNDKNVKVSQQPMLFLKKVQLNHEFVHLICKTDYNKTFGEDVFATIFRKKEVEKRCKLTEELPSQSKEKLNVLFLGLDSVSRLNYIRHLPKTIEYSQEILGMVQLKGYNKVADNTFPNLIPLLTGFYDSEIYNGSLWDTPLDNFPMIWKNFSSAGYRTLLAEDRSDITGFNYLKFGFKQQPVDYYYRTFSRYLEQTQTYKYSSSNCFRQKPTFDLLANYTIDFIEEFNHNPHFAFAFFTGVTHDRLNDASLMDNKMLRVLKRLNENRSLNNTIMFIFSDHGMRFGDIRNTYTGQMEERLPFMSIYLPDWFKSKYPEHWTNMQTNQKRLTTPFDIHETLKDILHFTGKVHTNTKVNKRGISLFNEVPFNRSCQDADIPEHWCTCQVSQPIDIQSNNAIGAGLATIDRINKLINQSKEKDLCMPLKLSKILMAFENRNKQAWYKTLEDEEIKSKKMASNTNKRMIQVTVQTSPNNATYEATLEVVNDKYVVVGDISRTNLYGNTTYCVKELKMKMFCHCKGKLDTSQANPWSSTVKVVNQWSKADNHQQTVTKATVIKQQSPTYSRPLTIINRLLSTDRHKLMVSNRQSSTVNGQSIIFQQSSTNGNRPTIINPQLSTGSYKPTVINRQSSTVNGQSIVFQQSSTNSNQPTIINPQLSTDSYKPTVINQDSSTDNHQPTNSKT